MAEVLGTGWLNQNALRNYPLSQNATGVSTDGSFRLPDELFVDLKLAVPYLYDSGAAGGTLNPAKFYISSLKVYPQGFVFFIGCDARAQIAVSDPISFAGFIENSIVAIKGISNNANLGAGAFDFSQVTGWAILGNVDALKVLAGQLTFDWAGGRLEPNVISYGPRRISGFKVFSNSSTSTLLAGQVVLNSGVNHRMNVDGSNQVGYTVTMNAINSENFQEECPCSDVELGPCIRTINNVPPDPNGDIVITGESCISVTAAESTSSIALDDVCAKPCCGCTELQVLVSDVNALTGQLTALQAEIAVLTASVNGLQDVCLGSQIDSVSCIDGADD